MEQREIGIGIVGTNFVSDWFADSVAASEGIRCAAVYSRTAEKGGEFALRHGIPAVYTNFEEFLSFLDEARFDKFGAFAYSREEGTPAYDFDGQLDEQVKQDRADRVMALQADITAAWSNARVGQTVPVLCEGYDVVGESWYGRSAADAPDIDGKVYFSSDKKRNEGDFVSVKITEAMDYDLIGEAVTK